MEFLKNNSKWLGLGGCLLTIIGCFLPYASVLGMSIKFASEGKDGNIVVVLLIVSAVLILLNKGKWSLIPSIIGLFISIYDGINVSNISTLVQLEIGFYVILIGLIIAIVTPFFMKKELSKK